MRHYKQAFCLRVEAWSAQSDGFSDPQAAHVASARVRARHPPRPPVHHSSLAHPSSCSACCPRPCWFCLVKRRAVRRRGASGDGGCLGKHLRTAGKTTHAPTRAQTPRGSVSTLPPGLARAHGATRSPWTTASTCASWCVPTLDRASSRTTGGRTPSPPKRLRVTAGTPHARVRTARARHWNGWVRGRATGD